MSLNLIDDPWIPVILKDGSHQVISPWQIAEGNAIRPDWPRADLNLACLELLIGLVYLADPPEHAEDWDDRREPDPARLRDRLAAYAPAFNLLGEGPLFLQDLEPLEGEAKQPEVLFIDSAAENAVDENKDIMVHRDRYAVLELPLAAIALFTLQAYAPEGGPGLRTSVRGGGPLVTLVDPQSDLWGLVWANVPDGKPGTLIDLPWMRATRVSDKGAVTPAPDGRTFGVEAFFGMPRRLRLVEEKGEIVGVIQRRHGTNYEGWAHPLTPYVSRDGKGLVAQHPKVGQFGYRHWLGVLVEASEGKAHLAACLRTWRVRDRKASPTILVGGWALKQAKPRDFTLSSQPYVDLPPDALAMLQGMILAAEQAALALRGALEPVLAGGEAREAEREAFYLRTEAEFMTCFDSLKAGTAPADVAKHWLGTLERQALKQFDDLALDGLDQRDVAIRAKHGKRISMQDLVKARGFLSATFIGTTKTGRDLRSFLKIESPAKKGKAA